MGADRSALSRIADSRAGWSGGCGRSSATQSLASAILPADGRDFQAADRTLREEDFAELRRQLWKLVGRWGTPAGLNEELVESALYFTDKLHCVEVVTMSDDILEATRGSV